MDLLGTPHSGATNSCTCIWQFQFSHAYQGLAPGNTWGLFDLEKDRPSGFCWMCILHAAPSQKPDVTRLLPTLEMR
ncbi:hypothetical protein BofuT4_uP134080.1 [Botrytis cinerea T4]|uniref:Uncharacterized protein n=1 Tax=Botryotinia fuckeliana (strain T4) TaxID=999810 RepID=G2YQF6_BOTF4|nr:hypothetical protein BofuT4_uP134080.1 [Botrytis cinerea T4]